MALLVYDMQVGICGQIRDGARIVERCAAALAAARRCGMRVVFTRHLSCPKNWMGTTQLRTAMTWQRTSDLEIAQSLAEHLGTQVRDEFSQFTVPVGTLLQSSQYDRLPFST
jgi:nicotinamidase-related amidase